MRQREMFMIHTFTTRIERDRNYTTDIVRTFYMVRESVAEQLDGAIGNKAGYQTEAAAHTQEIKFRAMQAAGIVHTYYASTYEGTRLELAFLRYDPTSIGYPRSSADPSHCSVRADSLGDSIALMDRGMRLIKRLHKIGAYGCNPTATAEALRKFKFVEVGLHPIFGEWVDVAMMDRS
jgi:hypothetical protein